MLMKKKLLSLDTMKEQVMEKAYPILCSTGVAFGTMLGNVCYADELNDVMKNVETIVKTMFKAIGFVLVLWGAGQLILAFKNEDSDSKSRAIMSIVAGVALYGFASVATKLGLKAPSFSS